MEVIENDSDSESIYMNVEDAEKNSNRSEIYESFYQNTTTEISGQNLFKRLYIIYIKTRHILSYVKSKKRNKLLFLNEKN